MGSKEKLLSNLYPYKVVLCSNSPRRKELLSKLNVKFETRVIQDVDESYDVTLSGEEIAKTISLKKANAYESTMNPDEMLITADTIVYVNGTVLGKPKDRDDAVRMLRILSANKHKVITGVCVMTKNRIENFCVSTEVSFVELSDDEIKFYVDQYKPYDKAGSYGIQEWIGYVGVDSIKGSFFNVMGLPIQKLYSVLKTF